MKLINIHIQNKENKKQFLSLNENGEYCWRKYDVNVACSFNSLEDLFISKKNDINLSLFINDNLELCSVVILKNKQSYSLRSFEKDFLVSDFNVLDSSYFNRLTYFRFKTTNIYLKNKKEKNVDVFNERKNEVYLFSLHKKYLNDDFDLTKSSFAFLNNSRIGNAVYSFYDFIDQEEFFQNHNADLENYFYFAVIKNS